MKPRKLLDKVAKKQAVDSNIRAVNLNLQEAAFLSLSNSANDEHANVSLKYYSPDHQCLSSWSADQLKAFSAFCRKMSQSTWESILKSGGKSGTKTGLGCTLHKDRKKLPKSPDIDKISPDVSWFELRVTDEARVHGFRCKSAFFLVFLDRQHQVYPE